MPTAAKNRNHAPLRMTKKTKAILFSSLALLLLGGGGACFYYLQQQKEPTTPFSTEDANGLPALARKQIGVTVGYSPDYVVLDYPGGDVPMETGVCTDVVVRALRHKGIDLQQWVHEDMEKNFRKYPGRKLWKQRAVDSSIDHRRVPNLEVFFERIGWSVTNTPGTDPSAYLPGDLVTCFDKEHGRPHIMIVSDRKDAATGIPKVIHNSGQGTQENDALFAFPVTGHYRPVYGDEIVLPGQQTKPESSESKK